MYPSTEDPLALNNALLPRNIFALHDGDPKLPIYIAVRGFVFDVSRDREVFGRGGPLNECAGREISRAIALGPPPSNNPPASSEQQGSGIEQSGGGAERADGVQEGLRSRARRGQSQGGTQQGQQQQQQQQQQGSGDEAPPLRITLRQSEIGKSKLHDCNDAQLVKVEEVLRMCREKYTQVGKLPEELHIDPLPVLGDKYAGPCLIMLVVFFSVLLLGGLFFALLAPLAGWGNDWFVGKGLQPGSVLSRSKLNRIITHEQLLPDEDYE